MTEVQATQALKPTTGGESASASHPIRAPASLCLAVAPEFGRVGCDEARLTINANLHAPEMHADVKRAPVSLSAVLDKSGSMHGYLGLVKGACGFMLGQLSARDKLGVIEYDSHVEEVIALAQTKPAFKEQAQKVIDSMRAGSMTNLSGGLFMGIKQQKENKYIDWDTLSEEHMAPSDPQGPSEASSVQSKASSAGSDWSILSAMRTGVLDTASGILRGLGGPAATVCEPATAKATPSSYPSVTSRNTIGGPGCGSASTDAFRDALYAGRGPGARRGQGQHGRVLMFGGKAPPSPKAVEADAVRSVFLFTDGQANDGVTEPERLVTMVRSLLDSAPRVRVYTFGFGHDHDERLLSKLAEAGRGSYYFVEQEEQIPMAFADALGGLLSVAAQNVTLAFVPEEGVQVEAVHTNFKSSVVGSQRQVQVGDLLSEESKDTLFDLRLPAISGVPQGEMRDYKLGHFVITFLDVAGASMQTLTVDCVVKRSRDDACGAMPNLSVSLQRARLQVVSALQESRSHADHGDFAASRQTLDSCASKLEQVIQAAQSAGDVTSLELARVLLADVKQAMEDTAEATVYMRKGKKKMAMMELHNMYQRSARCDDGFDDDILECGEAASAASHNVARSGNRMQQQMRSFAKSVSRR